MWEGKNFIKGEFQDWNGETFENINPSEEESFGKFPISTKETVEEALDFKSVTEVADDTLDFGSLLTV